MVSLSNSNFIRPKYLNSNPSSSDIEVEKLLKELDLSVHILSLQHHLHSLAPQLIRPINDSVYRQANVRLHLHLQQLLPVSLVQVTLHQVGHGSDNRPNQASSQSPKRKPTTFNLNKSDALIFGGVMQHYVRLFRHFER